MTGDHPGIGAVSSDLQAGPSGRLISLCHSAGSDRFQHRRVTQPFEITPHASDVAAPYLTQEAINSDLGGGKALREIRDNGFRLTFAKCVHGEACMDGLVTAAQPLLSRG